MKNIYQYIVEKFIINKNTKISNIADLDNVDKNLLLAIVKSVFISVYKNNTYKIRGISNYVITRSNIEWKDIADILETEYDYNIDKDDLLKKNGKFQTFVRHRLNLIEALINMKKVYFRFNNGDIIETNGRDIYWQDWRNYRDKYNLAK